MKGVAPGGGNARFCRREVSMVDEKDKLTAALLEKSSLYQQYLAEREEVLRHKWLESERMGRDIGLERALMDWVLNHRTKWRKSRQAAGE